MTTFTLQTCIYIRYYAPEESQEAETLSKLKAGNLELLDYCFNNNLRECSTNRRIGANIIEGCMGETMFITPTSLICSGGLLCRFWSGPLYSRFCQDHIYRSDLNYNNSTLGCSAISHSSSISICSRAYKYFLVLIFC